MVRRAEDLTQLVQPNFLADIKLDQDEHRPVKGLIDRPWCHPGALRESALRDCAFQAERSSGE